MEDCVLRTRRVLEDGEDSGHGATDVLRVQGHCHVDGSIGAHAVAIVFVGVHFFIVDSGDGRAVR